MRSATAISCRIRAGFTRPARKRRPCPGESRDPASKERLGPGLRRGTAHWRRNNMRAEAQAHVDQIRSALDLLRRFLDWDRALRRLEDLNAKVEDQALWDDP